MRYCKKGFVNRKEKTRSCGHCKEIMTCKKEQANTHRAMNGAMREVNRIFGK